LCRALISWRCRIVGNVLQLAIMSSILPPSGGFCLRALRVPGFLYLSVAPIAALMSDLYFRGESNVASGTVKWFNATKGYGFIAPDDGGKDVFVHISAVEKAGMDGLPEGGKITYDMISDRGKESAGNLVLK